MMIIEIDNYLHCELEENLMLITVYHTFMLGLKRHSISTICLW